MVTSVHRELITMLGLPRDLALNRGSWVCHLLPGQGGRALWMLPGWVALMLGPGRALNRFLGPHT